MFNFLRRILCRHDYNITTSTYERLPDNRMGDITGKSKACSKCGNIKIFKI